MRSAPTSGERAVKPSMDSSGSKLIQHWRRKYSDGSNFKVRYLPLELAAVVVEALEPRDDPSAVGLEEDELGVGEALAHAARGDPHDRVHHVDRVGERLAEEHPAREVQSLTRPGRSGARNGCNAIGSPVSALACQIGS